MKQSCHVEDVKLIKSRPVFSYANYDDCRRYGVHPLLSNWSRHWIKERIKPGLGTVGILANEIGGNYLEIWEKYRQPHSFYNLVYSNNPLFPWMTPTQRKKIKKLNLRPNTLDQVVSIRGFQYLSEEEMRVFLSQVQRALKPNGTLVIAATHFFNLSHKSMETLKYSFPLQERNQAVALPGLLSLKKLQSFAPHLSLARYNNIKETPDTKPINDEQLKADRSVIKMALKKVFRDNFNEKEREQLFHARDALITVMGFELAINKKESRECNQIQMH